jgi:hypothetical protein
VTSPHLVLLHFPPDGANVLVIFLGFINPESFRKPFINRLPEIGGQNDQVINSRRNKDTEGKLKPGNGT